MMTWGLCTTLDAPLEQIEAFLAHHFALGAAEIHLYLDRPEAIAQASLPRDPRLIITRCDADYWEQLMGRRPHKHQRRQSRNAQHAYDHCQLNWLGHIDVDEFLLPETGMSIEAVLAAQAPEQPLCRMAPWEALHDPDMAPDIFTARHFRAALARKTDKAAHELLFGRYGVLLDSGALSHSAGKCFFRNGIKGIELRIHGGFIHGERINGIDFCHGIALLHFHAHDPEAWRKRLGFRLKRGAYSFNEPLRNWLMAAGEEEIDAFYHSLQTVTPEHLARLEQARALKVVTLELEAQRRRFLNS